MKATILSLFSVLLAIGIIEGQSIERQAIASAGNTLTNGNISLDFTIGEVAVTTLTTSDLILTQGFHQGELMTTSVDGLPVSVTYKIYPNPTKDKLWLEMTGEALDFYVLLYNELGQPLSVTKRHVQGIGQWQGNFDLSKLSAGLYLFVFADLNGKWLASHKFVKQ